MNFVELLAPARDLQSAAAAVDYGADAVYIGGGASSERAMRRATVRSRSPVSRGMPTVTACGCMPRSIP